MRSEKNIEQSLKEADLSIEINARTDRAVLQELITAQKASRSRAPRPPALKLAAAATLVITTVLIWYGATPDRGHVTVEPPKETRVETLNLVSLNATFRRGGMEAVDAQYRKVFAEPQPEPRRVSVEVLLTELTENGES
jgi:hypothetical protein